MKKQIITIAGAPGSGKSSTADLVAEKLGFRRFSTGDFFRRKALEWGISLDEISKRAESDPSIDKMADDEDRRLRNEDKIVIDSRLSFHWIPESFKVYLDLSPDIAKNRILNNLKENKLRQESENSANADEIYKKITDRLRSERKRFWDLYKIDHTDKKNFDLVVDTNKNNLPEVANIILEKYKTWVEN